MESAPNETNDEKLTAVAGGGQSVAVRLGGHDRPDRVRGDALRRSLFWTLVAWIPGAFWMAMTSGGTATILATYLGATAFWIGVMTAAPQIAVALQLPGALIVEALGRRKAFFIWTVTLHRVIYIVIGLLPWVLPRAQVTSAALMVLLLAVSLGLNNFGGQAWVNWMADLVPQRVRGKYFAKRSRAGIAVMIVTSLLLGAALDAVATTGFPARLGPVVTWSGLPPLILFISVVFMVAGAVGTLDILAFSWVDEPRMTRSAEPLRHKLRRPLSDRQFLTYCGYWSVWSFAGNFSATLWWVYVLEFFKSLSAGGDAGWLVRHQYLMSFVMLSASYQVGQFLGFPIWGKAVDRFGRKPVLFMSSTLHTASWAFWVMLSPGLLPWIPLVQLCAGVAGGGQDIGSFNMMLHYNRKGGAAYQAVGSKIFAFAGAVGAITSGTLLGMLDGFELTVSVGTWAHSFNKYAVLIVMAMLIKYLADLAVLPYVHDVAARPRLETARFVVQNMYGAINDLVIAPVVTGIEKTGRTLGQVKEKVGDVAGVAGATFKRWFR